MAAEDAVQHHSNAEAQNISLSSSSTKSFADMVRSSKQQVHPPFAAKSFSQFIHGKEGPSLASKTPSTYKGEAAIFFSKSEEDSLSSPFQFTLVGKFSKGRPAMEDIRKFFKALDFKSSVQLGLLDSRHILLQCELEVDFLRLWSRSIWYVLGFVMRVFKWSADFHVDRESAFAPVWISFPKLPVHLFKKDALFAISSIIGHPLICDAATLALTRPSVARVLIEVDLRNVIPRRLWIGREEAAGFWQEIQPEFVPHYCSICYHVGHAPEICHFNGEGIPALAPEKREIQEQIKVQVVPSKLVYRPKMKQTESKSIRSSPEAQIVEEQQHNAMIANQKINDEPATEELDMGGTETEFSNQDVILNKEKPQELNQTDIKRHAPLPDGIPSENAITFISKAEGNTVNIPTRQVAQNRVVEKPRIRKATKFSVHSNMVGQKKETKGDTNLSSKQTLVEVPLNTDKGPKCGESCPRVEHELDDHYQQPLTWNEQTKQDITKPVCPSSTSAHRELSNIEREEITISVQGSEHAAVVSQALGKSNHIDKAQSEVQELGQTEIIQHKCTSTRKEESNSSEVLIELQTSMKNFSVQIDECVDPAFVDDEEHGGKGNSGNEIHVYPLSNGSFRVGEQVILASDLGHFIQSSVEEVASRLFDYAADDLCHANEKAPIIEESEGDKSDQEELTVRDQVETLMDTNGLSPRNQFHLSRINCESSKKLGVPANNLIVNLADQAISEDLNIASPSRFSDLNDGDPSSRKVEKVSSPHGNDSVIKKYIDVKDMSQVIDSGGLSPRKSRKFGKVRSESTKELKVARLRPKRGYDRFMDLIANS